MDKRAKALQRILDAGTDDKNLFGSSFALSSDSFYWEGSAGDLGTDSLYFIASTTKLFTSALIFQLRSEGKLKLDDKIITYLDSDVVQGLHVYKGHDYSGELRIEHLLSHTSGLADYFQDKQGKKESLQDRLLRGEDQSWTFSEALNLGKSISPLFAPGQKGKAHYSDLNYQLLGKIIEHITGVSFAANCDQKIIQPLGLVHTYLYTDSLDKRPHHLYYGNKHLVIPKAMTSFGADGGMVSTSAELLIFTKAFFNGVLFPKQYIDEISIWRPIFSPLESGAGIHRFKLPWIFNPTGAVPVYIGHSGLSGALAFYCPEKKLFIAGTVNQVAKPQLSFKTMIKLTLAATRKYE
ncbi:MAG: beta-lactamase family protein [Bacteroidetes bacterium]|nr:beta-lactamase family protein [Bacteroidota bacterium]